MITGEKFLESKDLEDYAVALDNKGEFIFISELLEEYHKKQLSLCSVSNWVRFEDNKPTLNERYLIVWDTYPPETRIWKKEDEDKDYSGLRWLPIPKWK